MDNHKTNILVVEDTQFWREAVREYFTEAGYHVSSCDDGLHALNEIRKSIPQVVILDYLLPRIDGKRICAIIKNEPQLSPIFTILLTATVDGGVPRSKLSEADAVVAKGPMEKTLDILGEVVQQFLLNRDTHIYKEQILQPSPLFPREITRKVMQMKEYLEMLRESITDYLFEIDDTMKIVNANARSAQLFNTVATRLLGRDIGELFALSAEDELLKSMKSIFHNDNLAHKGPFLHTLEEVYLESTVSRIPSVFGNKGAVIISRDVTSRISAEHKVKEKEEQLRQSQRLEAVGRFASGLAHDLSNIMTVISGNAEILQYIAPLGLNPDKNVNEIMAAVRRGTDFIKRLLTIARQRIGKPRLIDLGKAVQNFENILKRLLEADIEVIVEIEQPLPLVTIDPNQFDQVLLNLAVNARDAMPRGGALTIKVSSETPPSKDTPEEEEKQRWVQLVFQDTGIGMDEQVLQHLFEPFFTTKEEGKGTGLGLSVVYGIVTECGGSIHVDSEVGKGTRFAIKLPAAKETHDLQPIIEKIEAVTGGNERILLAEDDRSVREVIKGLLEIHGYQVVEARTGDQALDRFRECLEQHITIDLLLADVVMPGLNGLQLAEEIHRHYPQLPVILVTGHSIDTILQRGSLSPTIKRIVKPINSQELLTTVRRELDRAVR